jgi:hypothetical protein
MELLLIMLRNNKQVPDSLVNYFASSDKKRLSLYNRLNNAKLVDKFPVKYHSQDQLVKSALTIEYSHDSKYDSLVYLDKLPASFKGKTGFVYFFKYKTKKEDKRWKVATYGIQPTDVSKFDDDSDAFNSNYNYYNDKDDIKLDDKKPVKEQLQAILQKMMFRKRKSARDFYSDHERNYDYEDRYSPRR